MMSNNHHNDGHVAVVIPAGIGIQEVLIKASPEKFYRPPYVGVRGWVGIELPRVTVESDFTSTRSLAIDRSGKIAGRGRRIPSRSEQLEKEGRKKKKPSYIVPSKSTKTKR